VARQGSILDNATSFDPVSHRREFPTCPGDGGGRGVKSGGKLRFDALMFALYFVALMGLSELLTCPVHRLFGRGLCFFFFGAPRGRFISYPNTVVEGCVVFDVLRATRR